MNLLASRAGRFSATQLASRFIGACRIRFALLVTKKANRAMALTKADMVDTLFNEIGLSKREARDLVNSYFQEMRASLAVGEQIKLSGFGNFNLRDKNERPGRNPGTGEETRITARRVVTFSPGQKLKARVEAYAGKSSHN